MSSMSKIVAASSIPLIAAVVLASCSRSPLTPEEQARFAAEAAARQAKLIEDQKLVKPVLISEVDGVRLYRTRDLERQQTVYFTTRGDLQFDETRRYGKFTTKTTVTVPGAPD